MSINQLVKPVTKKWLDTNIGGVIIDGELTYDEANKVAGDSLVLDITKTAKWTPTANIPVGNAFVGRLASTTLTGSTAIRLGITSLYPYPTIYSIINGTSVRVSDAGTYLVICGVFSTDSSAAFDVDFQKNGSSLGSSKQVTSITPILSYNKVNNFTFTPISLSPGDDILVTASCPGGTVNTYSTGSFLLISKID